MKKIFINPAVPKELKEHLEQATAALRIHTAEGKAILLTEFRKRLDETVKELRDQGFDKAIPDESIMRAMAEGREGDAQKVFQDISKKAFWEGCALICAVFSNFKKDVLIENE